jgi:hypothetical protein
MNASDKDLKNNPVLDIAKFVVRNVDTTLKELDILDEIVDIVNEDVVVLIDESVLEIVDDMVKVFDNCLKEVRSLVVTKLVVK